MRYGGGQWQTWFDRDLSLCGKIIYESNDEILTKIIRIDEALFNIPNLAIHLTDKGKPFDWNNENHLKLIFPMGLNLPQENEETPLDKKLGTKLANLISKVSGIKKELILDYFSVNSFGYWEEEKYIPLRGESDKEMAKKLGLR